MSWLDRTPSPLWHDKVEQDSWRPAVVCLCGSTRFHATFAAEGLRLTLAGKIVLSIGTTAPDAMTLAHPESEMGRRQKRLLDRLHFEKVILADEVYVLNVGGYVGESTKNEIRVAEAFGKRITWWDEEHAVKLLNGEQDGVAAQIRVTRGACLL